MSLLIIRGIGILILLLIAFPFLNSGCRFFTGFSIIEWGTGKRKYYCQNCQLTIPVRIKTLHKKESNLIIYCPQCTLTAYRKWSWD